MECVKGDERSFSHSLIRPFYLDCKVAVV